MTSIKTEMCTKESIAPALGKLSSGVYIATLEYQKEKHGMLATWIAQAAFEPPMLTISVQTQRDLLRFLSNGTAFSVNALGKKNMDIFKAFAKPLKEGEDRFADLELLKLPTSGPVFAQAISYLDCVVKGQIQAGDHVVILAEVLAGKLLNEDEPMLHTRKNGFQY